MRINSTQRSNGVGGRARTRRAGGGQFSLGSTPAAAAASGVASSQSIQGIEAILSIQSVEDSTAGRRHALAEGEEILDLLEDLKLGLLTGSVPLEKVRRLADTVARRTASGDADVDRLLDEIELRAQVELAKLGKVAD